MDVPVFTQPVYVYRVLEVTKVVDADTIDVVLDLGLHVRIHRRLRFMGIDTWEVRGEEREKGLVAKARLEEMLDEAYDFYVQTVMDAEGKYGRVLAQLWTEKEGQMTCLNEVLLTEGHGTEYPS